MFHRTFFMITLLLLSEGSFAGNPYVDWIPKTPLCAREFAEDANDNSIQIVVLQHEDVATVECLTFDSITPHEAQLKEIGSWCSTERRECYLYSVGGEIKPWVNRWKSDIEQRAYEPVIRTLFLHGRYGEAPCTDNYEQEYLEMEHFRALAYYVSEFDDYSKPTYKCVGRGGFESVEDAIRSVLKICQKKTSSRKKYQKCYLYDYSGFQDPSILAWQIYDKTFRGVANKFWDDHGDEITRSLKEDEREDAIRRAERKKEREARIKRNQTAMLAVLGAVTAAGASTQLPSDQGVDNPPGADGNVRDTTPPQTSASGGTDNPLEYFTESFREKVEWCSSPGNDCNLDIEVEIKHPETGAVVGRVGIYVRPVEADMERNNLDYRVSIWNGSPCKLTIDATTLTNGRSIANTWDIGSTNLEPSETIKSKIKTFGFKEGGRDKAQISILGHIHDCQLRYDPALQKWTAS